MANPPTRYVVSVGTGATTDSTTSCLQQQHQHSTSNSGDNSPGKRRNLGRERISLFPGGHGDRERKGHQNTTGLRERGRGWSECRVLCGLLGAAEKQTLQNFYVRTYSSLQSRAVSWKFLAGTLYRRQAVFGAGFGVAGGLGVGLLAMRRQH